MVDLLISSVLVLVIVAGNLLAYRRVGGGWVLFFTALVLGYFSALPAGWINGWIQVLVPAQGWILLLSALVEEGIRVGVFSALSRGSKVSRPRSLFWLAGALWSGFGIFELVLHYLSDAPLPGFLWLPLVVHCLLGLIWAGVLLVTNGRRELQFIILVLLHGGFNTLMVRGLAFEAGLLTIVLAVTAVILFIRGSSKEKFI